MKKLFVFILFVFLIASCKIPVEDRIRKNIAEVCIVEDPEELESGEIFYSFPVRHLGREGYIFVDKFKAEPLLIHGIEKAVRSVPQKESGLKLSTPEKIAMRSYEWNTLEARVTLECYYPERTDSTGSYLEVKIWIMPK